MNTSFKVYSKGRVSSDSDSIFSILRKDEVGLSKSLAALLFHEPRFLERFLDFLHVHVDHARDKVLVFAEQQSDHGDQLLRRDVSILIKQERKKILIVIEAKHPKLLLSNPAPISNQLNQYFSEENFSDISEADEKIGITLTKTLLKTTRANMNYESYISLTWKDLFFLSSGDEGESSLAYFFNNELKRASFMKTYTDEVFSPPTGDTHHLIEELKVYCCPAERVLRDALYLMPRIPVNGNEHILGSYDGVDVSRYRGHGFATQMYEIKDTFVADSEALEVIEQDELREAVDRWVDKREIRLRVFVLGDAMPFDRPKITELKNNAYQGYYSLSQIWGDQIPPSGA